MTCDELARRLVELEAPMRNGVWRTTKPRALRPDAINLAPGVEFDELRHEYWYKGRRLSGVTRRIQERMGIKIPDGLLEEHRVEGTHVHQAIQEWIDTGVTASVHPGVRWCIENLPDRATLHAEVLVSDFTRYASPVDIVRDCGDHFVIYDVKKGVFKREYLSWQLGIYKYLIERYAGRTVAKCWCICLKDRDFYLIKPKPVEKVEDLLYGT